MDISPDITADQATQILDQHTADLEKGLDALQVKTQTDPTARDIGVTPPSELPPTPDFSGVTPVGQLETPEATELGQAGLAANVAQPPPTAPEVPWPDIANSDAFKKLRSVDQIHAIINYAKQAGDFARYSGADPNAVHAQTTDFVNKEYEKLFDVPDNWSDTVTNAAVGIPKGIGDFVLGIARVPYDMVKEGVKAPVELYQGISALVQGKGWKEADAFLAGQDPNAPEGSSFFSRLNSAYQELKKSKAPLGPDLDAAVIKYFPDSFMGQLTAANQQPGSEAAFRANTNVIANLLGFALGGKVLGRAAKEQTSKAITQYNFDAAKADTYKANGLPRSAAAAQSAAEADFNARMANVRSIHEELAKFKAGGVKAVSPEARAVIFGVDPEVAGTTVEQAQAYADKIGVKWTPPARPAPAPEPATPAAAAEPVKPAPARTEPAVAPAPEPAATAVAEPEPAAAAEPQQALGGRGLAITPHPDLPHIPPGSRITGAVLTALSGANKGEVLAHGSTHADAFGKATEEIMSKSDISPQDLERFDQLSESQGQDVGHRFGVVDREGKPILDENGKEVTLSRTDAGLLATGERRPIQSQEINQRIEQQGEQNASKEPSAEPVGQQPGGETSIGGQGRSGVEPGNEGAKAAGEVTPAGREAPEVKQAEEPVKPISQWHTTESARAAEAAVKAKQAAAFAKIGKTAAVEPKPGEPHELANTIGRDLGKQLVLPKEFDAQTDFIRVTDEKGRKSVIPASDLKGSNVLQGAGPFTKIEAGRKPMTGPNKGQFEPYKEAVTTTYAKQTPTQAKTEPAATAAEPAAATQRPTRQRGSRAAGQQRADSGRGERPLSRDEQGSYSKLRGANQKDLYGRLRAILHSNDLAKGHELVTGTHPLNVNSRHRGQIFFSPVMFARLVSRRGDEATQIAFIHSAFEHEALHSADPLFGNRALAALDGAILKRSYKEQADAFLEFVGPGNIKRDNRSFSMEFAAAVAQARLGLKVPSSFYFDGANDALIPKFANHEYWPAFEARIKTMMERAKSGYTGKLPADVSDSLTEQPAEEPPFNTEPTETEVARPDIVKNLQAQSADPGLIAVINKGLDVIPDESRDHFISSLPGIGKVMGEVKNVPDYVDEAVGKIWDDAKALAKAFAPANQWAAWLNAAEAKTNVAAQQAVNNVKGVLREVMQRPFKEQTFTKPIETLKAQQRAKRDARALAFTVEAGVDRSQLTLMQNKIQKAIDSGRYDSKRDDGLGGVFWRKRANEAVSAIIHAKNNLSRMGQAAAAYAKETNAQIMFEHANGQDTPFRANYVPHDYEDNRGFGLFGGQSATSGKAFEKTRDFPTLADAIANGETPSTLNALDLLHNRLRAGLGYINKQLWAESGKNISDPGSGKPIVTKMQVKTNPSTGKTEISPPAGYVERTLGLQPIAVHEGFYPMMFSMMTTPSILRDIPLANVALRTEGAIKHGLLLFDSYHLGRLAFYASSLGVKPTGYLKGLMTLDYSADELRNMERRGELPPEIKAVDVIKQKELLQLALNEGLNVGAIQDAVNAGVVQKIPGIGRFNRFVFDQFQRGIMTQVFMTEFPRVKESFPELSDQQVARKVAHDLNTRFGNLGKEGWFRSDTLRDLASLSFLAPSWNEGLLRSETGFYKEAAKSAGDLAFKGKLRYSSLLKSSGILLLSVLLANQAINYITRGHSTFSNPEEGIGAKLSAWIPDKIGGGPGFFLNPMTLPMELSHQVLEVMDKTGASARDAIEQVVGYKISPPARVAKTVTMGTDRFGRALDHNWLAYAKEMVMDVAPLPIATAAVGAMIKSLTKQKVSEPYKGAIEKQGFAVGGVKLDSAASPQTRIYALATKFNANHNIERNPNFSTADYGKLNQALNANDVAQAQIEYNRLRTKRTFTQINKHYIDQVSYPFTGNPNTEQAFINTLNPEQKETYHKAVQQKWTLRNTFFNANLKTPKNAPE